MEYIDDVTVIIPAAGDVPESLRPLSNKSSVAMVTMNGKPVIYWTLSYLKSLGYRHFVFAVRNHKSMLESFVTHIFTPELEIKFVCPDRDGGVGYSVMQCSQVLETTKILLVLGDTFFEFPKLSSAESNKNYVLVSPVNEYYRWCIAEHDSTNKITSFIDKPNNYSSNGDALIGVYKINDWPLFHTCLQSAWQNKKKCPKKVELSEALTSYTHKHPIHAYPAKEWFDCGNPDNLFRSRRTLMQKREFNTVTFDDLLGTITKQSKNTEKFIDEIDYYKLIPSELHILFPRVISSETLPDQTHITMEYYGYPTLSELLVFENLRPRVWYRIFDHLYQIIQRMMKYTIEADEYSFDYMYNRRVEDRINEIKETSGPLASLVTCKKPLIINGNSCANFYDIWPLIKDELNCLYNAQKFCVMHGDLCFSNILYDLTNGISKFIDPRGSFGRKGCYGDIRYDIAKLYHSIHGSYDYITNDLFRLVCHDNSIEFEVFHNQNMADIKGSFDTIFFNNLFNKREILLLEGMLFVTMGIFHQDAPLRQQAMYITGITIWNELMQNGSDTSILSNCSIEKSNQQKA